LRPYNVSGRAVLIHTGWERQWRTAGYAVDAPYLTRAATAWLVEHGAVLVGIDSINVDDVADKSRPVHTGLLRAGSRSSSTCAPWTSCRSPDSRSTPRRRGSSGSARSRCAPTR
jgi:hypothetical protein